MLCSSSTSGLRRYFTEDKKKNKHEEKKGFASEPALAQPKAQNLSEDSRDISKIQGRIVGRRGNWGGRINDGGGGGRG